MSANIVNLDTAAKRAGLSNSMGVSIEKRDRLHYLYNHSAPGLADLFQMLDESARITLFIFDRELWGISGVWLVRTEFVDFGKPVEYRVIRTDREIGQVTITLADRRTDGSGVNWGNSPKVTIVFHMNSGPAFQLEASSANDCDGLVELFHYIQTGRGDLPTQGPKAD